MQSFNHKPLNESILNIRKSDVPACSDVWELHVWLTKLTSHNRYSLEMLHGSSASRRPLMCTWRFFLRCWLELLASVQAAPVHFYTEDLIQHGLPSVLWLDLHYVSDASRWLNLHCYAVCVHWGKKKLTSWGNTGLLLMKQKKISHLTFCTHTLSLIMIWAIRDISPVCRWLYGAGRAPCMPLLFCPCHLQGALWDMTNGVLCLKDCGVWCESVPWVVVKLITWDWTVTLSLSGDPVGRQERIAMRLELAAYPGHRGENNSFFLFFYFPPVCVFDLYIWLKSQTRSTGAIGHQYLPMCTGR